MKRRLFNAGALVSLMLFLGICALWVRSFWVADYVARGRQALLSEEGRILFDGEHSRVSLVSHWRWWREPPDGRIAFKYRWCRSVWSDPRWSGASYVAMFGFACALDAPRMVIVPHAAVAAAFALTPGLWVWRHRGVVGNSRITCPACGYALRGTPGSECPECGAVSSEGREAKE